MIETNMKTGIPPVKDISNSRLWTARGMRGIVILFMLFDGIGKFAKPVSVVEGTITLGFTEHHLATLGALVLLCTVLYAIPRTRFLGALLLPQRIRIFSRMLAHSQDFTSFNFRQRVRNKEAGSRSSSFFCSYVLSTLEDVHLLIQTQTRKIRIVTGYKKAINPNKVYLQVPLFKIVLGLREKHWVKPELSFPLFRIICLVDLPIKPFCSNESQKPGPICGF